MRFLCVEPQLTLCDSVPLILRSRARRTQAKSFAETKTNDAPVLLHCANCRHYVRSDGVQRGLWCWIQPSSRSRYGLMSSRIARSTFGGLHHPCWRNSTARPPTTRLRCAIPHKLANRNLRRRTRYGCRTRPRCGKRPRRGRWTRPRPCRS